jgi:hypothetical protein
MREAFEHPVLLEKEGNDAVPNPDVSSLVLIPFGNELTIVSAPARLMALSMAARDPNFWT